MSQKWIVKDSLGQISGPFDTSEIITRIHQDFISEDDFVASYPEGRWIPVTRNQVFFNEMLEALSKGVIKKKNPKDDRSFAENKSKKAFKDKSEEVGKSLNGEKTKAHRLQEGEKTEVIQEEGQKPSTAQKNKNYSLKSESKEAGLSRTSTGKIQARYSQKEILDLKKHKPQNFIYRNKKNISGVLVFCLILGLAFSFWPEDSQINIHKDFKFSLPKFGAYPLSKEEEEKKMGQAIAHIKKGGYRNFVKSYNYLTQVLESNPSQIEAFSFLCFTYFHLWEFSKKTLRDTQVISALVRKAISKDRFGERGKVCKFVNDMIKEKYDEAEKGVVDVINSQEGSSSVAFNYFGGLIKSLNSNFVSAEAYMSKAISGNLGNEFAVIWLSLANINLKLNRSELAYKAVLNTLTINPKYIEALFLKGIIEYINFGNEGQAERSLQRGFSLIKNDKSDRKILSEAHLIWAQILFNKGDQKRAVERAILAYKYNPGNIIAKSLIIQWGGKNKIRDKKILSRQLFIEGEESFREIGCSSAQALFKEAFRLDPKNGLAALKTAECLWSLKFSKEAIKWVEKAIQSNPTSVQAYLMAAHFYKERYDFDAALKVFAKGLKISPQSYEIYAGLARLELKKEDPESAVEYAKRALRIYDAHTEALIVISEAYLVMDKNQEALRYVVRAIENEDVNVRAQGVYGRALYRTQGIYTAQQYLENRINSNPLEGSYRVVLAQLLLEDQKFIEAEKMAKEALELNEDSKETLMVLGEILRARNKNNEALNFFLDAFSVDPTDVKPIFEAGKIYFFEGQFNAAVAQFQRLISVNPNYPKVYYNLAKVYKASGKMDQALESCKYEIRNYPRKSECFLLNAEIYFHKGHEEKNKQSKWSLQKVSPENALQVEEDKKIAYNQMLAFFNLCSENYQKALDIIKPSTRTYINMSKCYRLVGEFDLSQKMVNQAMKLENGNPLIWRESGFLLDQKGEFSLALDAYKKYLTLNPTAEDRSDIVNRMERLEEEMEEPLKEDES